MLVVIHLIRPLLLVGLTACNPPPEAEVATKTPLSAPVKPVSAIDPLDPHLCGDTLPAKFVEYDRLRAAGEHWKAAGLLRLCAQYGTSEIKKRVEDAEISSHQTVINDPKASLKEKRQAMERLIVDYPTLGKQYEAKVTKMETPQEKAERISDTRRRRTEGVSLGMSPEEVISSSWGKPQRVNKTTTKYGTSEQWVYGGNNYLYFENGQLVAIQS